MNAPSLAGLRASAMERRVVDLGRESLDFLVGSRCADEIGDAVAGLRPDLVVVVTDDVVLDRARAVVEAIRAVVPVVVLTEPPGESMKSMQVLEKHLNGAIEAGASKRSVVVALGGGVPGNLAGMVAGLLFRGVRLVHVPTNLAAASDSVISLKQAVNSDWGKNQIGLYRRPEAILVDLALFDSLTDRERRAAMCEALKNVLAIMPEELDDFSARVARQALPANEADLHWMLDSCLRAKTRVMRDDPYEQGAALALEYGHTVGHALELYERRVHGAAGVTHGEAIGFGLVVAAHVSRRLGYLDDADVLLHESLAAAVGAPRRLPADVSPAAILDIVRLDNKRGYVETAPDEVPMVVLEAFGQPVTRDGMPIVPVPRGVLEGVLADLRDVRS